MLVMDRRPAVIALALSLLTGSWVAATASPARAADDVTAGLVLRYALDEASGTVATDSSGNGRHGAVNGGATWSGDQGLAFNGTDAYVKVPDDVMSGLSSISVDFDVNVAAGQATPYFLYGFGNTDTATGYGNGYLFATGNAFRGSISLSNWVGEQSTSPSPGRNLTRGTWKHVTYTQTGGTGILYEDGVAVGTNLSIGVLPSAIGGGHTTANYLGRSLYTGDRYFNGRLRDFRVYDRALTASEASTLAGRSNTEAVAADTAALTLGDTGAVVSNLTLPASGANGSGITWSSSDTSVVSDAGVVTRPAGADATVTLSATIRRGDVAETKAFTVVVAAANDHATVAAAARALVVRNAGDVRGNLTLPTTGESGTTVSWASSDLAVISATGEVHRPAHGAGAASVTLTATVRLNAASTTRDIAATVPELPAAAPLKGYLFSYFTGEGTANGEQVYNALSNGNDALSWREINDGNPVLTSTLGTQGLRDPFIIRSPEGDKFYQIATDLKIYGNGDWDASQRTGSKSIMVWESTDLVHWTDQRLVKVSPDTAGNTWAPEAFYDEELGAYVVFWASKLYEATDPGHTGSTYNRMMYATTRDFHSFSEPKVWKDPGYSVIDSTVVKHGGTYYRITKDERNNTSSTPCSKFLVEERSTQLRDLDYDFVAECIGKGSLSAGEGPLVFKSNTAEKWYLFIDEFGGRGYVPFETTDLDSGTWTMVPSYSLPSRPRHGTVLPVTAAEYDRLLAAYQPDQFAASVSPAAVTTGVGQAPVLPATVPATYADGVARSASVAWDAVDPSAYAATGTFTVRGTLVDNASVRATATVTVVPDPVPQSHLRLRYQFDETSGAVVRDSSGNGFDATYNRTPGHGTGVQGGSFAMSGGPSSSTTAPYVTIPNGVLKDASAVTVSTWVKWNASTTVNQWIYGLGPDSTRYLFSSPRNGGGILYSAITTGSWSTESGLRGATALPGGWQHLAVTVDSGSRTAVMYLNGSRVATATGVTAAPSDLYDATRTATGYVGRSLYSADPYFAGEVDDFRVYDVALSPAEVLELAGRTASVAAVTLPQLKVDAIVDDAAGAVTLPLRGGSDVTKVAPEFTLARGATISPASGTVRDLTKPVTYTVTGSDGAVRSWTVRALVMRSPVLPGLYADPNIAVFGDTFWIYPTTDGFAGWSGTQFHAFSSTDLVHWTDHGVALDLGPDVSWADDSAWAPTIAERNGRYYLYFSGGASSGDTRKQLGVAVADSPAGPFRDALGKPLVAAGSYSGQMIDADVFTDDDGASYLYWGNGNSYQVRLNDDMTSFDPAQVRTYHPANYNEGSFVFERGGTYYFSWSENDTRSPDYQVAYATGTSPLGPWSERKGVVLAKDAGLGILGTGHHSVVRLPNSDEWYVAYHRFAIPGGDGTHRETTVDRLRFEADGSIRPVVPTLESVDPVTVAHAGADATGVEGSAIALRGTVSNDANRPAWSYTAGPGVDPGATCVFADAHAAGTSIACTDDGTYTVTLATGGSHDSAQVTVTNAAPVVTAPGGRPAPNAPVATGVAVGVPVAVTDAGRNDAASCTADWGDGSTSAGVVSGTTCRVSHAYTRAGLFRPVVTVRDDDGGASAPVTTPYVVTYVPGTGSAAGGGWFTSPTWGSVGGQIAQGSLKGSAANQRVTGVADIAFTAGPRAGGATWFQFAAGGLRLEATSQRPALVVGPVATYYGTASVNGVGGHTFLVTAVDGGRHGSDLVSVTVWDARARVVYAVGFTRLSGGGVVTSPKR